MKQLWNETDVFRLTKCLQTLTHSSRVVHFLPADTVQAYLLDHAVQRVIV